MISLDTLKLLLPEDSVQEINWNNFTPIEDLSANGTTIIKETTYVNNPTIGFNRFELNKLRNEVMITVSAKILTENYYQGINRNTIEQLVNNINKVGICKVHIDEILKAKTLRVDPVNNIEVDNIKKALDAIILFGSANTDYTMKRMKYGYIANRNVKSYKERQIGYSKLEEIKSNKSKMNTEWIRPFGENTLRIESNLSSFKRMRKAFDVSDNKLKSILDSTANPNYDLFKKIVSKGLKSKTGSEFYETLSFKELRTLKGSEGILNDFQWDLNKTTNWIKHRYPRTKKSNPATRYLKEIRESYNVLMANKEKHDYPTIKEIEAKLYVA